MLNVCSHVLKQNTYGDNVTAGVCYEQRTEEGHVLRRLVRAHPLLHVCEHDGAISGEALQRDGI